ncbi:MAG: hypothetical protein UU78_C0060G0005 [Candidatus Roizmanbacteria bacterium GW2011_GWC2_41_7]|uniref:DUF4145 domain-containing protein n=1 Tax=Candidatus Roizmanbacteria bacterium GW2011_GWC2_41_7 TaxID=1618487 RepID=A0A0G0X6D7_9BACT|nr:hypothetical protein [uncultured bacterium]KKS20540.1 MAG: hypothetical protein UU78_C0060G0005 [Candidatus Roizmanbacteria bacterium GW2011_GWC2_41_7]KKT17049.1 MAG: hypothetical protein UV98_C0017G0004 [Parcubacteria group bacterium GW2011_GWB1_43_6]
MLDLILNILSAVREFILFLSGTRLFFNLKWLGTILSLIFGAFIIILIVKLKVIDSWFKTAGNFLLTQAFPKRHLNKSWQKILIRLEKSDEANLRLALIEADNLFDDLLKQMRLPGESMADRLRYIDSSQISNIDEIWRAHKLRNVLVHNHEYQITRNEMEFGVKAYEKALKELEFID